MSAKDNAIQRHFWWPWAAIPNKTPLTTSSSNLLEVVNVSTTESTINSTSFNESLWQQVLQEFDGSQMWQYNNESDINIPFNDTVLFTAAAGGVLNSSAVNSTGFYSDETTVELVTMIVTAIFLGIVILATVIGNVFVIAAILLERNLQNVANYLILSLAVADLLVACLVMPLGAVYEVSQQWTLGPELCDMWTSSDVLCCTASILHLVAIALDRYWAVTNIDYIHQRTARRIMVMILVVWVVSFLVCVAPMLGWKDPDWEKRVAEDLVCLISQDIGYQIFATASSFYLPLLVILVLYWRIFQTARKRIRRRQQGKARQTYPEPLANAPTMALNAIGLRWKVQSGGARPSGGAPMTPLTSSSGMMMGAAQSAVMASAVATLIGRPLPTISETTTTAFTNVSSNNTSPEKGSLGNGIEVDLPTTECPMSYAQYSRIYKRKSREALDSKRERKAAKTLAIITGAFVFCWLPFFVLAILMPTCASCDLSEHLVAFFLWLGYFNSTLNPIIYTIFSPEFRNAFKRLLCGRRNSLRRRTRHFGRHIQ